jgi:HlyD family secretion protein
VKTRQASLDSQRKQYELSKLGPRKEQIDAQRAAVRQLEGSLAMASIDLDNTIIRAPVDGTVLKRNVEVGEFITTGFVGEGGAKGFIVSLADLKDLRVELDISQNDFAKVVPKQPCRIVTDAYRERQYRGVVDLISPEANRQKATVQVRVKVLDPDELLKPDMNATVSFLAPRAATQSSTATASIAHPSIRVPASAVRGGAVFVVENGKAVRRTVEVSKPVGVNNDVEVRAGLIGGEDLIVSPPDSLEDGSRVRVQQQKS